MPCGKYLYTVCVLFLVDCPIIWCLCKQRSCHWRQMWNKCANITTETLIIDYSDWHSFETSELDDVSTWIPTKIPNITSWLQSWPPEWCNTPEVAANSDDPEEEWFSCQSKPVAGNWTKFSRDTETEYDWREFKVTVVTSLTSQNSVQKTSGSVAATGFPLHEFRLAGTISSQKAITSEILSIACWHDDKQWSCWANSIAKETKA